MHGHSILRFTILYAMHWIRSTHSNRLIYTYINIFRFYIASCAYTSTTMYTHIDEYGSCIRPGGSANIWKCTQVAERVCPMMIVYWYQGTWYPGTRREYRTGLSVHRRKYYMFIQCGRRGFARPRKPGQSNRGMYFTFTNHIIYVEAGTYNGIFWTGDFRTKNSGTWIPFRWWCLTLSNSDSNILVTVEKADFVEFWDNNS